MTAPPTCLAKSPRMTWDENTQTHGIEKHEVHINGFIDASWVPHPCRIFSIDPPTARDLDDALSIKALPGGSFQVGVHIADVAYFVPAGSALDAEARERGTSVYLVDRVIPMLPRLLCEQLCSLNPGKAYSSPHEGRCTAT